MTITGIHLPSIFSFYLQGFPEFLLLTHHIDWRPPGEVEAGGREGLLLQTKVCGHCDGGRCTHLRSSVPICVYVSLSITSVSKDIAYNRMYLKWKLRSSNPVFQALEIFRKDIMDLYTTPRLSDPVWLSMMSHPNYRYQICENFMKELVMLINKFDNKNNEL